MTVYCKGAWFIWPYFLECYFHDGDFPNKFSFSFYALKMSKCKKFKLTNSFRKNDLKINGLENQQVFPCNDHLRKKIRNVNEIKKYTGMKRANTIFAQAIHINLLEKSWFNSGTNANNWLISVISVQTKPLPYNVQWKCHPNSRRKAAPRDWLKFL